MAYAKSNRRDWIKQVTAFGAGSLLMTPALSNGWPVPVSDRGLIKLSSNENPYGPSKKAQLALLKYTGINNRYPFDLVTDLEEALAAKNGLKKSSVLLGAGSSELLQSLGLWIIYEKLPLTYSSPTFEILPRFIQRLNGEVQAVHMTKHFLYDMEKILATSSEKPGAVYLVNPNNPTGTKIPKTDLINFCREVTKHSYLILDEAYIEYVSDNESLVTEITYNPKLIVLRTFSKIYGLAGLRMGYLLAHASLINELKSFCIWGNHSLNAAGIISAKESLNDQKFVEESRSNNKAVKELTTNALRALNIIPYPSETNFIFFPIPRGIDLRSMLASQNISIGQLKIKSTSYARVTIGTKNEMNQFIKHLYNIYN